jgi:hypothetical protein
MNLSLMLVVSICWISNFGNEQFNSQNTNDFSYSSKHVRYKKDGKWEEHKDFKFWEEANAKEGSREAMWITEVWTPNTSLISNVVFCIAGQQGTQAISADFPNIVTGQTDNWRPKDNDKTNDMIIKRNSIAGKIIEDGEEKRGSLYGFKKENTLFVLIQDAGFYIALSEENKKEMENGYYQYIMDRIGGKDNKVKTFCFIGASRGGALSTRLTRRLKGADRTADANFLLATLDAVADEKDGECGTTETSEQNPENSKYKAFQTQLSAYFNSPSATQLKMLQIVGGAAVPLTNKHAFINKGTTTFEYQSEWVNMTHTECCRDWNDKSSKALLAWLDEKR